MPRRSKPHRAPSAARRIFLLEQRLDLLAQQFGTATEQGRMQRAARWIDRSGPTRLVAAFGIWLFLISLIAFGLDLRDRQVERQVRAEEAQFRQLAQVATAWELLLVKAGGDVGKGNALNTILRAQGKISGADLSCEAVGVWKNGICIAPPQFNNVRMTNGDFWEDDPERHISGAFGGTAPYLFDVDFRGAKLNGLVAEQLWLTEKFDGVSGSDWEVRNLWFARPTSRTSQGPSWRFACMNCTFFYSSLPHNSLNSIRYPRLYHTTIWRGSDVQPFPRGYRFTTFLEAPAVFVSRAVEQEADRAVRTGQADNFDVESFIDWQMYEDGDYCVTPEDVNALDAYKTEIDELRAVTGNRYMLRFAREAHLHGEKKNLYETKRIPDIVIEEPIVVVDFGRNDPDRFTNQYRVQGPVDEKPVTRNYDCAYSYEDVAPLLKERVRTILKQRMLWR